MFQQSGKSGAYLLFKLVAFEGAFFCAVAKWKINKGGSFEPQLDRPKIIRTSGGKCFAAWHNETSCRIRIKCNCFKVISPHILSEFISKMATSYFFPIRFHSYICPARDGLITALTSAFNVGFPSVCHSKL